MKRHSQSQKYVALVCSCALLFLLTLGQADAARRSPALAITLFVSGMGFQVGSTMLNSAAETRYNEYLNTAIQSEIASHKDAVIARRNASTIMSRVGFGCVGLAVFLSIYNQLASAAPEPEPEPEPLSQVHPLINVGTYSSASLISSRVSLSNNRLVGLSRFGIHPHYDFQTRRASLQFQHRF